MDLDFQFEVLNGFELMMDTTVCQEETQEAIVPDASPDILRILDTRAQTFLTGKQVRDGIVTISGMVRACVFYQPESDSSVRHVDITLPFVCQAEHSGVSSQAKVLAYPRICWAEARVLNPRKVLLRAEITTAADVYCPGSTEYAVGAAGEGLQILQKSQICNDIFRCLEWSSHHKTCAHLKSDLLEIKQASAAVFKCQLRRMQAAVVFRSCGFMAQQITICACIII